MACSMGAATVKAASTPQLGVVICVLPMRNLSREEMTGFLETHSSRTAALGLHTGPSVLKPVFMTTGGHAFFVIFFSVFLSFVSITLFPWVYSECSLFLGLKYLLNSTVPI